MSKKRTISVPVAGYELSPYAPDIAAGANIEGKILLKRPIDRTTKRNADAEVLIKSKERVRDYAEVYTPRHIVKDMLDMLPDSLDYLNATFFEPACGNGNFLVEILERKLKLCKSSEDVLTAVRTIYAVDLLPDNVVEAKERMWELVKGCGISVPEMDVWLALNLNVQQGNTLTGKKANGKPILIFDWKSGKKQALNDMMPGQGEFDFG